MLSTHPLESDVAVLRSRVGGTVVLPGDEGWDAARQAWNLAVDQRPAVVALPRSASDVQALVDFARTHGLRIAMQGTGHNASPMGPLEDTMLVKTSEMRGVEIDAAHCVARVEAGALWIDVTAPASELGLAPLAGSSPDVGVVGYTLGGGLSWLGRRYGLASNRLLAAELVTADGQLIRASRHENAEVFWALRGGGGNFGAVVAIEFELIPLREVYAGMLLFDAARSREVLQAWREWTTTVPDTVDDLRADDAVPAAPRAARVPARAQRRDRRRRDRRARRARRGAAGPAPRPRAGDGHLRLDPAGRALAHPHGSRGPDPGHGRLAPPRRADRRDDRRARRRRRARAPGARCCWSSSATSAARWAATRAAR